MPPTLTEAKAFTVSAPPSTDLWRKPPSTDVNTAARKPLCTIPLSTFSSAGVTFRAPWTHRYDQGGLLLYFPRSSGKDKWVKSGVEFYQGKPYLSTVTTDNYADWSLAPVKTREGAAGEEGGKDVGVTIEARRQPDELGTGLWVYQILVDAEGRELERVPLRECTWVFAEEEGVSVEVSAYAARPAEGGEGDVLEVEFKRAWVERV